MNKSYIKFLIAALFVALILAVFISPFASSSPDGLEKVAANKGFLATSEKEGVTVWNSSPIANYAMPGFRSNFLSKGVAGFLGVIAVFILGFLFAKIISKKRKEDLATLIKKGENT